METVLQNKSHSLIESMFKVGAHYGYSRTKRHPSFVPILFGAKDRVDIIDLEKTGSFLSSALEFIKKTAQENQTILFVGTKPEARRAIQEVIVPLGAPYVSLRWIGGTLTNLSEVRKRVARLEELQQKFDKEELEMYTKKERLLLERELNDLVRKFGGIVSMTHLPKVLCVVDPKNEHTALREAKIKNIPVVALAGTDCDIGAVTYPIPANDSAQPSIRFFMEKIAEAYKDGQSATTQQVPDNKPLASD